MDTRDLLDRFVATSYRGLADRHRPGVCANCTALGDRCELGQIFLAKAVAARKPDPLRDCGEHPAFTDDYTRVPCRCGRPWFDCGCIAVLDAGRVQP